MQNLLANEWLKIKKYRTVWIILGLFALLLTLFNYGIIKGFMRMGGNNVNILSQSYSFPNIWSNIAYYTSNLVVFPAILIIILTTNEYQFRTNRQNIIDGWERLQFYHAKWQVILSLSVFTTLFAFILGMVLGYIQSGSFSSCFDNTSKLFYLFVLCVNYYGFALLLSIFLKRSGITIGIFMLYCAVIEVMLHMYFNYGLKYEAANLFLPLQSSDNLLPFPLSDMASKLVGISQGPPPYAYVIASTVWIVLYYFIGRKRLLSTDW